MPPGADPFIVILSLVGAVIVVSALLSGLIERSGVPQMGVLLALGAILGPFGLGFIDPKLDSPMLRVVSMLSLALVLFTDALSLSLPEIRKHARLALLVVGPGTVLSAVLITVAGRLLLGLPWALAAILGAALASTDPVLLRGLMRRPELPSSTRLALRLESGLNDVVLLPIVLVAMAFLGSGHALEEPGGGSRMALQLFLLGPGAGVAVGLLGVATLDLVRRRLGVRRDYESLYSLGLCFAAFAAAESVHGSGFLAAFAAGMTISIFDVELCDCFQEYGETTAELALLFTFVLLGSSLIWTGIGTAGGAEWVFAILCLLVRPLVLLISLKPARLDRHSLFLIAWYGPRGLSSLLLVLLPVFAHTPGSVRLFELCSLVVLLSVVLHGGSLMFAGRKKAQALIEEREPAPLPPAAPSPLRVVSESLPESIDIAEMKRLQDAGEPVVILDVRTLRSLESSDLRAVGAIRLDPERAVQEAERLKLPKETWLIAFCA
ncbi:MAG: sodium/hydrogen antiporter [Acidobacteriota bacterium]|jgi:NhaP-type Na+/H+ or K+/H+ antiporter|nr:sodium/hydrogen antiporter [Acidobacteriota bacterium]